jgi:hypothetical protein
MKYYLDAAALTLLSDLRLEVVENIRSKNLPVAIKNDLQLEFNNWFDSRVQAIYRDGVSLPSEAATTAPENNYYPSP